MIPSFLERENLYTRVIIEKANSGAKQCSIRWYIGHKGITLNGDFMLPELEEIVEMMRTEKK